MYSQAALEDLKAKDSEKMCAKLRHCQERGAQCSDPTCYFVKIEPIPQIDHYRHVR